MNDSATERFAERVQNVAASFDYPPTPDIAVGVREQLAIPQRAAAMPRRTWAAGLATVLLLAILATLTITPARAALFRFMRIGAIEINLLDESTAVPELQSVSLVDLGQAISLAEAADYITLDDPAFPPVLSRPDEVYVQRLFYREPVVIFLWHPTAVHPQIILVQIETPNFGLKLASGEQVTQTEVGGQPAVWIEGPHLFDLVGGSVDEQAVIATNVLIWADEFATYRLEGALSLGEARQIAESWP